MPKENEIINRLEELFSSGVPERHPERDEEESPAGQATYSPKAEPGTDQEQLLQELRISQGQLAKRVRELKCLSDIGHKVDERPSLPEFLEWVADCVPAAMQFPEICLSAITYQDKVFGKPEATQLPHKIV